MKFLKKNLLIIFAIFVSIIMGSSAIVNATENAGVQENSAIVNEDENIKITQKIVENTGDTVRFKVDVENLNQSENINKENPVEVVLLIDNSGTMEGNRLNLLKQPAIDFVNKIASAGDNVKISLVDCSGVKVNFGKDTDTIKNNINNLKINGDYYLDELLKLSKNQFSTDTDTQKYIVLFTDNTDTVSEETKAQLSDIEMKTLIIDNDESKGFIGTNYYVNNNTEQGMLDGAIDDIYSDIVFSGTNSISNLEISKVFSEDVLKIYDIKNVKVSKGNIVKTTNGYTWNIPEHRAGAVASLEILLQIKNDANFKDVANSTKILKTIDTTYDKNSETINMPQITESPMVGLGFAVQIKFVNAIDKTTPIDGITAEVIASNIKDKILYSNEDATTNNGIIDGVNINQIGDIYLTIEPTKIPGKCKYIDQKDIYLNNNGTTVTIDDENTSDGILVEYDSENNVLNITILVKTDTINFNIVKKDNINSNMYIGNAGFSITDKNNLKSEGITDKEGTVTIEAENVGAGTHAYILNEEKAPNGYNLNSEETINVTLDNEGKITNAISASGNLEIDFDEENVNIIAKDERNAEFDKAQLKLVDEDDHTINLKDAEYKIYMESENGSLIKIEDITDFYGIINAEYFYDGETSIKIIETKAPRGYCLDEEEKLVTIKKDENGELQFVEDKTTSGAEFSIENNKLFILLTNKKKEIQNNIEIKTVSSTDDNIELRGMEVELIDSEGNKVSGLTDINGKFSVEAIEGKSEGIHKYTVKVLENIVYATSEMQYDVFIEFDKNGNIVDINSNELFVNVEETEDKATIYKNANINIAIESEELIYFKLKKQDVLNSANIEGAKYKIEVQATWEGNAATQVVEKETNSDGEINIAIPAGDTITLTIQELSAAPNYKIDNSRKIIKLKYEDNIYKLDTETTDGINVVVDNDNAKVILYEKAQKKVDSNEKGNINLNIEKINESNEILSGVKFSYTLAKETKNKYGEIFLTTIKSGEATTDSLGKISITDLPINTAGKYKIYLRETSTLIPYELASNIVIDLRYEEIDEKLQVQSFIIKKGNDVIQETSTKEYEDDNFFQYDINLKIVNKYKSTIKDIIDNTELDKSYNNNNLFYIELNKYKNGSILVPLKDAKYRVVISYEDGKQIIKEVTTMGYDYLRRSSAYIGKAYIRPIYVEGTVTVDITEIQAPAGYELDNTTYRLVVEGNKEDGITNVSSPNIDNYTKTNDKIAIKLYDNKKPGEISATKVSTSGFYVQVHKADNTDENILLGGATYNVQLEKNGTSIKNETLSTNSFGVLSTSKIYEKDDITLKIRETSAPFGYALDSQEKTIQLDVQETKIGIVGNDDNVKVVVDDSNRIVHIYETNERDRFVLAINKVDNKYHYSSLYNAAFDLQIDNGEVIKEYRASRGVSSFYPNIAENSTIIYTITETKAPTGYRKLDKPVKVQVEFDENGYIKTATLLEDEGSNVVGIKTDNRYYLRLNIKNNETTYKYSSGGTGGTGGTGGSGGTGGTLVETPDIETADKYKIVFNTVDIDTGNKIVAKYDAELSSADGINRRYNGVDEIVSYNGYGQIIVNFEQDEVPTNYYIDSELKQLVFIRGIDNTLTYVQKSGIFEVNIDSSSKVITITVKNKKDNPLKLTIETVDNLDEQIKLRNAEFDVTDIATGKTVITNEYGLGSTDLDKPNSTTFEYTITEKLAPAEYLKRAPKVVKISAQYDSDKNIVNAEITEGSDFASLTYDKKELYLKINYIEDVVEDEYRYQLKVIKQDKNTGVNLENAEFEIDIEKESGATKKAIKTTDELGTFKVNYLRSYGTTVYKILETKSPVGYKLDDVVKQITISNNGPENVSATCNDTNVKVQVDNINHVIIATIKNSVDPKYISLGIENTDSLDERIKIPGSVFGITDNQTNEVYEITTKDKGIGLINIPAKLSDGEYTYKIVQKSVPAGYIQLVGVEIELQIKFTAGNIEEAKIITGNQVSRVKNFDDRNALVEIMNKREISSDEEIDPIPDNLKPYSVHINKVDENNFEIPISNALLDISITNQTGIENIFVEDRTNTAGKISIENIDGFGEININIMEKEAPEGRQLDTRNRHIALSRSPLTGAITHTSSENIYYDIDNSTREINLYIVNKEALDKFTIGINQLDTDNNYVGGFEYKIIVENLNKDIVINANGYGALSNIPKPESSGTYTYTIQQTKVPEGYKLLQNDITFDVTFDEDLSITRVDNVGTPAKLVKTTYSNNADGRLIRTMNEITTGEITTGNYIEFAIQNEKMPEYKLELTVVNKDNVSQKLSGAKFEVEFLNTDTGETIQKIDLTDATDTEGKLLIDKIKSVGNITIKITQRETPKGYKTETLMQTIKINRNVYTGEITAIEGIEQDDIDATTLTIKKQIENELKDGQFILKIEKVNEENEALSNAYFTLKEENEEEEIELVETDSTGRTERVVALGKDKTTFKYIVKEKTAPIGYKLAENNNLEIETGIREDGTYGVTNAKLNGEVISTENDIINIKVVDELIDPYIVAIKTLDKNDATKAVSGAEYTIRIKNPNTNETIKEIQNAELQDIAGIATSENLYGVERILIEVEQTKAPYGYEALDNPVRRVIIERDTVTGEIALEEEAETGITQIEGNKVLIQIGNELKEGKVQVHVIKKNVDGETLQGAKFKVTKEDTTVAAEKTTNENGEITFDIALDKVIGEYTYKLEETKAPAGYRVEASKEITIKTGIKEDRYRAIQAKIGDEELTITQDLDANDIITVEIIDQKVEGFKVEVETVNSEDTTQQIDDVEYTIVIENANNGEVIRTITNDNLTKVNKILQTPEINTVGNIRIKVLQTKAADGYDKAELVTKVIARNENTGEMTTSNAGIVIDNENQVVKMTIENTPKAPTIGLELTKVNENRAVMKGAGFTLTKNGETSGEEKTTGDNGKVKFDITLVKAEGEYTYKLEETTVPLGYKKADDISVSIKVAKQLNGSYIVEQVKSGDEILTIENNTASLQVANELINPYKVEIKTVNKNDTTKVATGAEYSLRIKNAETGALIRTIENADLKAIAEAVETPDIYGVGRIKIEIEQTKAPYGYEALENNVTTLIIARDIVTGAITLENGTAQIEGNTISVEIGNELKEGKIQVHVIKKNTDGEVLQGAKFKITKEDKTVAAEQTTNASGEVNFEITLDKVVGEYTYRLEETKAPAGYRVEAPKEIIIKTGIREDRYRGTEATIDGQVTTITQDEEGNDIINIEIVNEKVEGFILELETVNSENNTQKLEGVEYTVRIKNAETGALIRTIANADLTKVSEVLQTPEIKTVGNIKIEIEQVKAEDGYEKAEIVIKEISRNENTGEMTTSNTGIVVDNENQVVKITIENTPKAPTVGLELTKVNEKQVGMKGAGFTLTKNGETSGEEKTTGDNGKAKFDITLEKEEGEYAYKLEETTVPLGYKKADDISVSIKVVKQLNGSYVVEQVKSGDEILAIGNNVASLQITNELINPYKVEIKTVNKNDTTKVAAGAQYTLRIKNAETGALIRTIENADLSEITEAVETPDIYGVGRIKIEIEQTKAPYGYEALENNVTTLIILRDTVTGAITLEEGTAQIEGNKISVEIGNELKEGKVQVHVIKKNQDGDTLQGAKFRIIKGDEVVSTQQTTNVNGEADFTINLEDIQGVYTYSLEETEAPAGYRVETAKEITIKTGIKEDRYRAIEAKIDEKAITITQDEEENDVINIEVIDEKVEGFKVEIETVNAEDTTQKLEGVEYTVTIENAETGAVIRTIANADLTKISEALQTPEIQAVGDIRIKISQTKAPVGYEKAEMVIKEIARDVNTGEITSLDDTIIIDNENGILKIIIANELEMPKVSIEITKLNENGAIFRGVGFTLLKGNQVVSGQKLTEYNGKVKFDIKLERQEGEYTYKIAETSVPEGYKFADNINVTIKVEKQANGSYAVTQVRKENTEGTEITTEEVPIVNNVAAIRIQNELMDPYKVEIKTVNKNNTDILAKGAEYVVRIKNAETGALIRTITNARLTKLTGISITPDIYGVGRIRIEVEQTKAPEGYNTLENNVAILTIERDKITGEITLVDGNATVDGNKVSLQVENELKQGKVQVQVVKKNEDGVVMQGAKFRITKDGEVVAQEQTTNSEGKVSFELTLEPEEGEYTYKLEETEAPSGYKVQTPKELVIKTGIENERYRATKVTTGLGNVSLEHGENGDDVINVEIVDEKVESFKVEVETVNSENKIQQIEGAEYTVVIENAETGAVIKTIPNADLTRISGVLQTPEVQAVGDIRIKISQIKTPDGYEKAQMVTKEISRNINNGEITSSDNTIVIDNVRRIVRITVENETKAPTISIDLTKVNEKQEVMSGAGFVLMKNGQTIGEEKITDATGKARFDITLDKQVGEAVYELKETTVPNGYKTPDKNVSIKVMVRKAQNGSYYVETVKKDDEVVNVSNGVAEVTIANKVIPPFGFSIMVHNDETPWINMVGQEFSVKIVNTTTGRVSYSNDRMITNNAGCLNFPDIYEVGDFEITIEQKTFDASVEDDRTIKTIKINRDIKNGNITVLDITGGNINVRVENYAYGEVAKVAVASITNKTVKPYFTLHLDRSDTVNKFYKLASATANVEIPTEAVVDTNTIRLTTNEEGKAQAQIPLPKNVGEYVYTINDISVPSIYTTITQPMQIKVKVKKDGTYVIENAEMIKNSNAVITNSSDKDIYVNIVNKRANSSNTSIINFNLSDWDKQGDYLKVVIENEERQKINVSDLYSVTTNSQGQKSLQKVFSSGNITIRIEEKKNDGTTVSSGIIRYNIQNRNITNVTTENLNNMEMSYITSSNKIVIKLMKGNNELSKMLPNYATRDLDSDGETDVIVVPVGTTDKMLYENSLLPEKPQIVVRERTLKASIDEQEEQETLLCTGMEAIIDGKTYMIAVAGDLDGNGKITITDLVKVNLHSVEIITLEGIYLIAADLNYDKQVTVTDVVRENLILVGIDIDKETEE